MALKELVRTKAQREANEIDMRLFNALCRAEAFASTNQNWRNLCQALRMARTHARFEMHPADRDVT